MAKSLWLFFGSDSSKLSLASSGRISIINVGTITLAVMHSYCHALLLSLPLAVTEDLLSTPSLIGDGRKYHMSMLCLSTFFSFLPHEV
jgi:hypothetical protein